jgi:hypothetical protein
VCEILCGIFKSDRLLGIFDNEPAPPEVIHEALSSLANHMGGAVVTAKQKTDGKATPEHNSGIMRLTLLRDTQIATGSGKFIPEMRSPPILSVRLLEMPDGYPAEKMKYTAATGTNFDFNINLRAAKYREPLPRGEYVFSYEAKTADGILGKQDSVN